MKTNIPEGEPFILHLYKHIEELFANAASQISEFLLKNVEGISISEEHAFTIEELATMVLGFKLEEKEFTVLVSLEETEIELYWGDLNASVSTLSEIPEVIKVIDR